MASMAEPNRKSDIPPPIIGKAGRYTVFITSPPMASPRSSPKPSPKFSPKPSPKSSLKPSPRPSKNVDVEAQAPPKTTQSQQSKMPQVLPDSFYTKVSDTINKIQNAYIRVDEVLADWFGLNQSKYQWALNEYMERKEMETEDGKPREAAVKGQEMHQVPEQVMKREDQPSP